MKITDPQAIRALAHPLRLDLIELLGAGPATAAECARALGSTQANCSFHLRQLAKYGLIAEAPAGPDRRERRWQLTDYRQSWSSDDPAAAGALRQVLARREAGRLIEWAARAPTEPTEWQRAAVLGGATIALTTDEVTDVVDRYRVIIDYLVATYGDRFGTRETWPAGARPVRLLMAASPLNPFEETHTDD